MVGLGEFSLQGVALPACMHKRASEVVPEQVTCFLLQLLLELRAAELSLKLVS